MIKAERYEKIMALVRAKNYISVNELIKQTGIAKSTMRRDLFDLEELGHLSRTHGGVCLPGSSSALKKASEEPSFRIRKSTNQSEKERIAEKAMEFVQANDTVILDSGSTTYELAKKIRNFDAPLMIATNDLSSALELSENDKLELVVVGGQVRKHHFSMVGYICDNVLKEMHADTVFLSADAVDMQHGLMAFSMQEVTSKRMMKDAAREVIALVDHTKFSSIAFVNICGLYDIDKIITGKELDSKTIDQIKSLGIEILLA